MKEKEIEQWEYDEIFCGIESIRDGHRKLREMGKDGWEAYAVVERSSIYNHITIYYLKRRLQK